MASTLLALLDDIATVLDDVAILSKVAAKKTAGVLGDDLALNAEQVSGVRAERELSVVWAVAKGSAINKLILVPAALALSIWLPGLVLPLLMLGGLYLCFEGAEKLAHKFFHSKDKKKEHHSQIIAAMVDNPEANLAAIERTKIKGAIRTDFILSAEIIVISLGTVAEAALQTRLLVLVTIAVLMTVGVYGLVAGIVKLDDLGQNLAMRASRVAQAFGRGILILAPKLMKILSIAGTAAMFLVGGGILVHGVPALHHGLEGMGAAVPGFGALVTNIGNGLAGLAAGFAVVAVVALVSRLRGKKSK